MDLQMPLPYVIRFELCLVGVLLIGLAVFNWPMETPKKDSDSYTERDHGLVQIEEVVRTRQSTAPPPPPKPLVPVPVPNDEVIPEQELTFENVNLPDTPLQTELEGIGQGPEEAGSKGPVKDPQQPPKIERIVEAIMTKEAREADVKAEITVSMLVDRNGDVEDASVAEIRVYDGEGNYKIVDHINYGLIGETLKAAFQWKFKPALQNGEPVPTYTNQVFSFGF
jgi:hypothetical protein